MLNRQFIIKFVVCNIFAHTKREAAKISGLSSRKVDEYEYLTGEAILPSDQNRIIEQAKFTYPPVNKAFEK